MAKKFPLGAWVYDSVDKFTPDEVDVWADLGLTVTMAPSINYDDDLTKLIPFLDRARDRDMQLILWVNGVGDSEERFRKVYEVFKGHPALYGFFIGDEPSTVPAMDYCINVMKMQKRVAPELNPYLNMAGSTYELKHILFPDKTYGEYLKELSERSGCTMFCFDTYTQMINDGGVTNYYKGAKAQFDASEYAGIDMWCTCLTSAHYAYKLPSEYQLLWQITVSAALGCKGIIWFRLYDKKIAPEYYGSPIDEYGCKTPQYDMLSRCQKRFNDQYGELLVKLHKKEVFITGIQRGDWPMFNCYSHDCIKQVNTFENTVVSFFTDDSGKEYLCLVNAEMYQNNSIEIVYDSSKCSITELLLNGTLERPDFGQDGQAFTLYPGQMKMFRIDRK